MNRHREIVLLELIFFFFQAEDGIRYRSPSRGLGDVYKRQLPLLRTREPWYDRPGAETLGGTSRAIRASIAGAVTPTTIDGRASSGANDPAAKAGELAADGGTHSRSHTIGWQDTILEDRRKLCFPHGSRHCISRHAGSGAA